MRKVTKLRPWQIEAIQAGRPARHFLVQAPGGSGKSLLQVMLGQADIEDTGNKQLILVPRNHIHHGFFDDDCIQFTLPGQDTLARWNVANNFCCTSKTDVKTALLKEYLLANVRDQRKNGQLAAIATHKAMVCAWARMRPAERKRALRNITIRIDEAHHISNVFHEADLELFNRKDQQSILDDATRLGQIVRDVLKQDEETVKLHLATATFFRGDRRTIISERLKGDFVHFYLPWDEHFQTLGIQRLQFDYLNYEDDPISDVVEMVRKEPKERHLIIIPARGHRFRRNDTVPSLMNGLHTVFSKEQILDLVTRTTQEAHKQLLMARPDHFRAVVACRLFDEGTDWVPCTRMHNTDACERSVTLAVQRFFRPLRPHPQKKNVRIYNYLPDFIPGMTNEEKREILSNRFNAFLACIVTQGELRPCLVSLKTGGPVESKPRLSLQEVFGEDYQLVMSDLLRGYEAVDDKKDSEQMEFLADRVLKKYDTPEQVDEDALKEALLAQLVRIANPKTQTIDSKTMIPEGIDAEAIRAQGFDKVWEKVSPISSVLCHGTDNIDVGTVRQLIDVIDMPPTLEEIHNAIRKFYDRTGKRPTFHQSEWVTELKRSARAIDKLCRRHYASTLAKEVRVVLGDANDDLLARTHDLIREYWSNGIRIGNKYGDLPEIGMSSVALNGRLQWNYDTTLAQEVERLLGPLAKPLTLPKVKEVVRKYLENGVRLHRKFGRIPELDLSSYGLADRLKRNFDVTLTEIVNEVAETLAG